MPKDRAARHQIRTSDGAQLSLAELRGQVVVLDFFATWCGHSKRHVPVISQLDTQRRADGLRVIGLAVEEQASTAAQFARDQQISYPVGTISDPIFANYVESRDVSVPQTLVYGRDGRLVAHFIGHSPEIETALAEAVRRELEKR
jgi:thiol-disulfide isomerase/thioredoxin